MKFRTLLSRSFVGLDVQATALRLLQLKHTRRGWLVEKMAERTLPAAIAAEGKIKDWDLLASVLIDWIDSLQVVGLPAALQIPVQLVHIQHLSLPKGLSIEQIMTEIGLKVRRDLPGMDDALSIDFSILSTNEHDMNVLFTVCRREYLLRYQECVEKSGLRVKIIDVDVYALLRVLSLQSSYIQRDSIFILHATQEMAMLAVFHLRELIFYQTWEISSAPDFLNSLNHNIALCKAVAPSVELTTLSVAAPTWVLDWLIQDVVWREQIICVDPFPLRKPDKYADMHLSSASFLLALGLAIREVPVW